VRYHGSACLCVQRFGLLLTPQDRAECEAREASLGHANCEAMDRREWMPSFVKIFST
jgi:hypothetical protein